MIAETLAVLALMGGTETFFYGSAQVNVHQTPSPRGRIILLHGFAGHGSFATEKPQDELLDGMLADGWQVVAPDLPYAGPDMSASLGVMFQRDPSGFSYVKLWERKFNALAAELDRRYGKLPLVVGGISWGGFNALQAACHSKREFAWFAQAPVVDPTRLTELSFYGPLPKLQLGVCAERLRQTRGLISHNLLDTRVGVQPTLNLIRKVRRLSVQTFPDLAHRTTAETNAGLLRWIRTLAS